MATPDPTRPGAPRPNATKPCGSDNSPRPKTPQVPTDLAWLDDLRPHRTPSSRRWRTPLAAVALTGVAVGGLAFSMPGADAARLAPEHCLSVVVQPGDTVWRIAAANQLTLDQVSALNPHIDNLSKVHPGDEIAVTCEPDGVALAPPVTVSSVDARWLDEREADGRLTWHAVVAHLAAQGMTGEELVTLAAIAECESNRWPNAVGDQQLANSTWNSSFGVWQVRALNAQTGTGGPRDAQALASSVSHQAWAAVEVWRSSGPRAWTCYRNGHHLGQMDTVRQAAAEIGVA